MDKVNKNNKLSTSEFVNSENFNNQRLDGNSISPQAWRQQYYRDWFNQNYSRDIKKGTSPEKTGSKANKNKPGDSKVVYQQHLPKNVNEYRHIIDTKQSRDSDVEWILELRAYNSKKSYESLKDSLGISPEVYREGLEEYKPKVDRELKERKENTLLLKGNSRDFEHVMVRRVGMQSNPSQLGFDSTLRQTDTKLKPSFENLPWKTLALSPKKSLLPLFLPPMTKHSAENIETIKNYVSRPLEQVEDVFFYNLEIFHRWKACS